MIADARHLPLKDKSVNCIITSPPYWSLRKYDIPDLIWDGDEKCEHNFRMELKKWHSDSGTGPRKEVFDDSFQVDGTRHGFCSKCSAWRGQLGLEPTIELYLNHLLQIVDECWRVLRDDGTCWINIGDSYGGSGSPGGDFRNKYRGDDYLRPYNRNDVPPKSLCLIPERFTIEMVNRGWILRNIIIWHKPNCMPASVKDRFTVDFEDIFFFTKSNDTQYWTNEKTGRLVSKQPLRTKGIEGEDWEWRKIEDGWQREGRSEIHELPNRIGSTYAKAKQKKVSLWSGHDYWFEQQIDGDQVRGRRGIGFATRDIVSVGRNRRCVWTIATQPYPESHFATFPEALIEPMIRAGCPQFVCKKCGKGREKILKSKDTSHDAETNASYPKGSNSNRLALLLQAARERGEEYHQELEFLGLTDCGCNAGWKPGIVLDPFCGSGTVMAVAERLSRAGIGFDLGYQGLQQKRMINIQKLLI